MTPQTVIIPAAANNASGVAGTHTNGKYFKLLATNGAIRVITSNGDEFDFSESGSGFGDVASPAFGKLTFYNDTGAPVTITFQVSNTPINTPDASISSTINVNASLSSSLLSSAEIVPGQFIKTITIAAGTVAVAALGTYATSITVIARKTLAPVDFGGTNNTGNVTIGFSNANGQPIELTPGDVWNFSVSAGRKLDLGKIYLDVLTDNDGVVVLYY
jgi:hypothetical protein